jgi:hypothetical protein
MLKIFQKFRYVWTLKQYVWSKIKAAGNWQKASGIKQLLLALDGQ